LDFVWTCFHTPRLWQGRDQKSTAVGSQGTNSVSHIPGFRCHLMEFLFPPAITFYRWLFVSIGCRMNASVITKGFTLRVISENPLKIARAFRRG